MKVARRSNLLDKMPNRSSVQANNTTSSASAPAAAVAAPALPPVSLGILGYDPFLCLFVAGRLSQICVRGMQVLLQKQK